MSTSGRLTEPSNYARPTDLRLGLGALAVYFCWSLLLIAQKPGLHYDEALHVSGAVHMLEHRGAFTLPHDPGAWASIRGRYFPLMSLPYTGAIKEYLCLPLFAALGPRMSVIRLTSMLLGALGIWGVYVLARERIGARIAAAVAFLLALNPSYINQTVFDTSAIGAWMAAFGFLCLMLSSYLRRASHAGAFLLGFAAGFAVWTRANFLWLLASVALAALLVLGRRFFPPPSHMARMAVGAVVGSAPFLIYQAISRGGTWKALGMYPDKGGFLYSAHVRIIMLSETLLADREHRAMWGAPEEMPSWEAWLMLAIVLAACCVCLWPRAKRDAARRAWERVAALSFLFLAAIMLSSRMAVSEHHLVVVLPLAALAVALAGSAIFSHGRVARGLVLVFSGIYVCLALSWNQRAFAGLGKTGGVGIWSDAAIPLTGHLTKFYSGTDIKILDWGLQYNLYVLSHGKIRSREVFGDAPAPQARLSGTYLLSGPTLRSFPDATGRFLAALKQQKVEARHATIAQRNGEIFAAIIDVQGDGCTGTAPAVKVTTGDPRCASQLEGFHYIEEGAWRWSSKEFTVTLGMPARRNATTILTLRFYLPESLIKQRGPVTLTAKLGGRVVAREVFRRAGPQALVGRLATATLDPRANTFQFALDKCTEPSSSDKRQLGVIVSSISLDRP